MKLYKYLSLSNQSLQWTKDVICNNHLYMANFRELNDPMEGVFPTDSMNQDAIDSIVYDKDRYRICSLTTSPYNMLMWTHYADSHKGCCIEFEINPSQLPKNFELVPVSYSNDGLFPTDTILSAKDYLSRKTKPWEYENEWRLLTQLTGDCQNKTYFPINITKVYLGCKIEELQLQNLKTSSGSLLNVERKFVHVDKFALKEYIISL